MPSRFIHICGHSGVGKKTLIEKLVANSPPGIRERFDVTDSFQVHGYLKGAHEMYAINYATVETIIHFWQDNTHPWIEHLKRRFPDAMHRAFLLWRDPEVHSRVLIARKTPSYAPSPAEVKKNWTESRVPQFRDIQKLGVDVQVVKLVEVAGYDTMPEWPA